MSAVQTINFHGEAAKRFGKIHKLAGEDLPRLFSGLTSRLGPEFKEFVRVNDWHICEDKLKAGNDLGEEDVGKKLGSKVLHFMPAVKGASAALRIIAGIILLVAAYYGFGNSYTVSLGISLILGGVTEMLTKPKLSQPGAINANDQRGSTIYNGALNVTTQGGPIPILYGRVQRASSVVISTDFSTDQS